MTPASWIRAETITEIVGELSSGRTSLMLACLRDVTVAGGTAALALMAFVAVGREGLETAVFVWSAVSAAGSGAGPVTGAVLGLVTATLPSGAPVWEGMRVSAIDLNGKNLRVAGGGQCRAP